MLPFFISGRLKKIIQLLEQSHFFFKKRKCSNLCNCTQPIFLHYSQLKSWSQIKVKVYAKEKEKLKSTVYYCFFINCWQGYPILCMPNERSPLTRAEAGTKSSQYILPWTYLSMYMTQARRNLFMNAPCVLRQEKHFSSPLKSLSQHSKVEVQFIVSESSYTYITPNWHNYTSSFIRKT